MVSKSLANLTKYLVVYTWQNIWLNRKNAFWFNYRILDEQQNGYLKQSKNLFHLTKNVLFCYDLVESNKYFYDLKF